MKLTIHPESKASKAFEYMIDRKKYVKKTIVFTLFLFFIALLMMQLPTCNKHFISNINHSSDQSLFNELYRKYLDSGSEPDKAYQKAKKAVEYRRKFRDER